ncbi:MAG: DHA2 family efflux MFS transporter permease subunit [Chlamydiales bacterium]|nr:DHA2 family efflux MFS transporter permease subunit [Chlamydiales bacterium]
MSFFQERLNWRNPKVISESSPLKRWIVLFVIIAATLLAIVSATATGVADSTISGALIIDSSSSTWISTAYLMAIGICLPLSGWSAERYGLKIIFFMGFAIFILGSLLASLSFNFTSLLMCRILEGAGAGLLFPISLTIVSKEFPKQLLSVAISLYMALGFGIGLAAGFAVGGYFAQFWVWQSIFFINVICGIPTLMAVWCFFTESEAKKMPAFDFLGYFFFAVFLINLLIVVNSAKQPWNTEGWTSNFILTSSALALVSLIIFICIELKAKNPAIDLRLYKITPFITGSLAIGVLGITLFGTVSFYPGFLEDQLHYDKSKAGLLMIPFGLIVGAVGSVSGMLTKYVNVKILSILGLGLLCLSCFMNMSITHYSDQWDIVTVLLVRGFGIGISIGPITALGLNNVPREILGQGTSMITFARQIGGAFGASLMSVVVVDRNEFHRQMFGASVNYYSAGFQKVLGGIQSHIASMKGKTDAGALAESKRLISENLLAQAQIAAIDDSYFLIGWTLAIISMVLISIMLTVYFKSKPA